MNKLLKYLLIISMILITVGTLLAIIGFWFGGFQSIILGPDGVYTTELIKINIH